MAGWTKAQYDAAYQILVERRLPGGYKDTSRPQAYVNYHKWAMKRIMAQRWSVLAPILSIPPNTPTLIVGAGFGWGVEEAIANGISPCIGIDISDYVIAEKDNTEEAELRQNLLDVGLDPDSPRGQFIMSHIYDGQPRSNVIILQEDAQTNTSRQAIRAGLGNNWPSVCIVEDIVDDSMTDAEIVQVNNALNLFAGNQRVIWIYTETSNRSLQDLKNLVTTSEVISVNGGVHLVI
jgi:hypothetical protein